MQRIRKTLLGISQVEMASIAATSQTTVSRWERGELLPDLGQMARIREEAQARGIDWNDSFFFDGAPSPAPDMGGFA